MGREDPLAEEEPGHDPAVEYVDERTMDGAASRIGDEYIIFKCINPPSPQDLSCENERHYLESTHARSRRILDLRFARSLAAFVRSIPLAGRSRVKLCVGGTAARLLTTRVRSPQPKLAGRSRCGESDTKEEGERWPRLLFLIAYNARQRAHFRRQCVGANYALRSFLPPSFLSRFPRLVVAAWPADRPFSSRFAAACWSNSYVHLMRGERYTKYRNFHCYQ